MRVQVGDFVLGAEEKEAIIKILESGRISEGINVKKFEDEWAKYVGTKYSVLFNSGTSAIMAGLTAVKYMNKIPDGSKVITTPVTYIATVNGIVTTNLKPVFVDIDKERFSIIPEQIEDLLKNAKDPSEYSIILPVHLMGYPCGMEKINKIAKKYGLITFEDSAQAHGSTYKGKKTGSLSLLSDFSFYLAHNIQAGEMGAITTDNPEIKRLLKKIKANGRMCECEVCTRSKGYCPRADFGKEEDFDPRFTHDMIGYNFKPMEFPAALGLVNLGKVDDILKKRISNVKYLNEGLKKFEHLFHLPEYSDKETISYLAYPLVIKRPDLISRKKLRAELEKRGIETRPLFGCIPTQQPAYSHLKEEYKGKLPNAEYVGLNAMYVGCHQFLTKEQLDYVIKSFEEILKGI